MHLKPSTQPPQAQSGQGQQELQVASGTASPEALGNVGDVCSERRVLQGLGARAMPVHPTQDNGPDCAINSADAQNVLGTIMFLHTDLSVHCTFCVPFACSKHGSKNPA